MAKKKKTRKQKILSDLRHPQITPRSDSPSATPSATNNAETPTSTHFHYSVEQKGSTAPQAIHKPVIDYRHIMHDLRKTAILTFSIVIMQVGLYFLVNKFW